MKVHELVSWLSSFEDQDAEIQIVEHHCGIGYCDQGGNAYEKFFDPEIHVEYTDFRENKFVQDEGYKDKRFLLLGAINW